MSSIATKAAIVAAALVIAKPSLGQPAPASPFPPDVCQKLAAFLQERGGKIDEPLDTPITLEEVNGYMEKNNVRACRSAISIMHSKKVDLPAPLLETAGIQKATQPGK
jgi:hypothetical protein